ncbi:putative C-type lectin domain family 20 member A [Hoplias malabaricus]|uniref:putative C-type lectin domain family 20 member A n=1 Tax=Hoplias malabaricus TaxID=27720 RepID=UPI0034628669
MLQGDLLINLGVCVLSLCSVTFVSSDFHFVSEAKSWYEAQNFCRLNFFALATIQTMNNSQQATAAIGSNGPQVWIGLYKTWGWSSATSPIYLDYNNWDSNEPASSPDNLCAVIQKNGRWSAVDCSMKQKCICYSVTTVLGVKVRSYRTSDDTLTWLEAQTYCRNSYIDLVNIGNLVENTLVLPFLGLSATAWIGLSKNTWIWSNNGRFSFRNWLKEEPTEPGQDCALINTNASSEWTEEDCNTPLPFLCNSDDNENQMTRNIRSKKQILSVEVRSDHNVNNPATKEAILEEIQQKLKNNWILENTLSWRVQPDGNVFQKKKNDEL